MIIARLLILVLIVVLVSLMLSSCGAHLGTELSLDLWVSPCEPQISLKASTDIDCPVGTF